MLEQPSLSFYTLDVECDADTTVTAQHVLGILGQEKSGFLSDYEFIQQRGILYVSRFVADENMNNRLRQIQGKSLVNMALGTSGNCSLDIQKVGQFDTVFFRQNSAEGPLDPYMVEVEVKSVGFNVKVCSNSPTIFLQGTSIDT